MEASIARLQEDLTVERQKVIMAAEVRFSSAYSRSLSGCKMQAGQKLVARVTQLEQEQSRDSETLKSMQRDLHEQREELEKWRESAYRLEVRQKQLRALAE